MKGSYPKLYKRLTLIFANSANTLLLPVLNLTISLIVIRVASLDLWGRFVSLLIVMNLVNHIIAWGNKEYLLREFSRHPGRISIIWQNNLSSRMPLYGLFLAVVLVLAIPGRMKGLLACWGLIAMFYQSCEALVVYHRKFLAAFILEAVLTAMLLGGIWVWRDQLRLDSLVFLVILGLSGKFLGLAVLFRKDIFSRFRGRFVPRYYKAAFPFFLLGLSGMLQSRIDLYCVAYYLSEKETGLYQVYLNLLIYVQVIPGLILQPFLKNIYRLRSEAIRKISRRLFLAGAGLALPALGGIYGILTIVYQFEFSFTWLLWGGLFILPIYYYLPTIYLLYKLDHPMKVLSINIYGTIVNGVCTVFLIQVTGLVGALVASALAQWIMMVVYIVYEKKVIRNHEIVMSGMSSSS